MGRIAVRLKPSARRDAIEVGPDGCVRMWVTAAPVDGKANARLAKLLAKALRVPKSAIAVVVGRTGRNKVIEVAGLSDEGILAGLRKCG